MIRCIITVICAWSIVLLILVGIIFNIIRMILANKQNDTHEASEASLMLEILIPVLAVISSFPIAMTLDATDEYSKDTYIVSLSRETQVGGSFCLGCGYVDSDLYYVAYQEISDNTYKLVQLKADGVIVHEDDSEKPHWTASKRKWDYAESTDLYVPVGTIYQNYSL